MSKPVKRVEENTDAGPLNRRSSQKTLKKYKKKKRRKIALLVIECIVFTGLLVCYGLISYAVKIQDKIYVDSTQEATLPELTMISEVGPQLPDLTLVSSTEDVVYTTPDYTMPSEKHTEEELSGYTTIAAFGVDARDTKTLLSGAQGDVIIVVSINNQTKEIKMVSVYRDFYFEAANGTYCKITDAYNRYGAEAIMAALNRNLDLEITEYVVVNWKAVTDVVNLMGGLDVNMTRDESEKLKDFIYETEVATGTKITTPVATMDGVQHLDGIATVCFCRIRKGVGDDYARTSRQRYVIELMVAKAKTMSLPQLYKIIETVTDEIRTTLDLLEIMTLAKDYNSYKIQGTSGFPMMYKTSEYIYADGMAANVSKLHEFFYGTSNYIPSANIYRIDAAHRDEVHRIWG